MSYMLITAIITVVGLAYIFWDLFRQSKRLEKHHKH